MISGEPNGLVRAWKETPQIAAEWLVVAAALVERIGETS
jgi:hypothetical protein